MFGWIATIFIYFFLFIWYCLKFLIYIILILIFLLWKHQGAILYQRHAPSRKRQLAYNPFPRVRTPQYYKLDFDDFFITTKDQVNIHCWLIRQQNSKECPTIICFHGNAGNIGYRLPNAYYMFLKLQSNIMMIDYRGYGNSEGVPTEKGLIYDAESILNHLLKRTDINLNKIFIFGRSLGGAVAIDLAWRCCTNKLKVVPQNKIIINDKKMDIINTNTNINVTNNSNSLSPPSNDELTHLNNSHNNDDSKIVIAGLIIENTFTSITDMVFVIIDEFLKSRQQQSSSNNNNNDNQIPLNDNNNTNENRFIKYFRMFLKWFITNNWDSLTKVKDITLPTLYLSGESDELIPPKQMKKLFAFAKKKSVLPVMQLFKDGDHNSTWQRAGQKYWDDIFAFLTSACFMAQNTVETI